MGHVGRALDKVFLEKVMNEDGKQGNFHKQVSYEADIRRFIQEFSEDKLFDKIPGRYHKAFPGFDSTIISQINRPKDLKERLLKYSDKLDELRELRVD